MKHIIISIALIATLFISSVSAAISPFSTVYTTSKDCGANAVYLGPNLPSVHGGICLSSTFGVRYLHVTYTKHKSDCNSRQPGTNYYGTYIGPNKAYEHGGNCLWIKDQSAVSQYTTSKNCPSGYIYAGPNRPDIHGGVCLKQPMVTPSWTPINSSAGTIYTESKEFCQFPSTYVGVNKPSIHGGHCLISTNPFGTHQNYTKSKASCSNSGGAYVGPNRPDIHGGSCLYGFFNPYTITSKSAANSCINYIGPNNASAHWGSCLN